MHLLPCPHCQALLSVSPARAGERLTCPGCQAVVAIPKLGDLRKLPRDPASDAETPTKVDAVAERSRRSETGFVVAGLIATASLLVASYCGIRWALAEVPNTTETHVASIRQELTQRTAAQLVREYEDMEKRGIDLGLPFKYKEFQLRKAEWGQNASIAAGIGGVALLIAVALARSARRVAAMRKTN